MKPAHAILALLLAATLGACYWTPGSMAEGGFSVRIAMARDVSPPPVLRAYLYDSADVSARWTDWYGSEWTDDPEPSSYYIESTETGDPILIGGNTYYEHRLTEWADSGTFTIPEVTPGRRYRLVLVLGDYWGQEWEVQNLALSGEFLVVAGAVVDVMVTLYYPELLPV